MLALSRPFALTGPAAAHRGATPATARGSLPGSSERRISPPTTPRPGPKGAWSPRRSRRQPAPRAPPTSPPAMKVTAACLTPRRAASITAAPQASRVPSTTAPPANCSWQAVLAPQGVGRIGPDMPTNAAAPPSQPINAAKLIFIARCSKGSSHSCGPTPRLLMIRLTGIPSGRAGLSLPGGTSPPRSPARRRTPSPPATSRAIDRADCGQEHAEDEDELDPGGTQAKHARSFVFHHGASVGQESLRRRRYRPALTCNLSPGGDSRKPRSIWRARATVNRTLPPGSAAAIGVHHSAALPSERAYSPGVIPTSRLRSCRSAAAIRTPPAGRSPSRSKTTPAASARRRP